MIKQIWKMASILGCLIPTSISFAQSWQNVIIRNELSIDFYNTPQHGSDEGKEFYISKANGCGYMVGIAPNDFKAYKTFENISEAEQEAIATNYLNDILAGKLGRGQQHLISSKVFKSGKYIGMDVVYTTLPPSNPESRKRFTTLLLIKDTLYLIECWYLDNRQHDEDKDKFFKSIKIK